MACGESGGSKILLCLGLLVAATSFSHCTRLTKLKALDKLRGNSTLSKDQAEGGDLRHGRLLIGQNSQQGDDFKGTKATENFLDVDTDYQEDMGWGQPKQPKVQGDGVSIPNSELGSTAVEQLLKMEPKVECTGDSMKLQVQDAASTPGSLLFVDRGSRISPLPLSKLPPSCGYTIKSTRRDLVLVAPYDGCFVSLEEDSYVLPLRWWGLPVRMSCPLMRQSSPNPPMVTCHTEGMVVKTGWTVSVAEINVNLNSNWEPLMKASSRCGFSVVVHPEGVVISVHYAPCLEKKDGMYTLELAGEGETKISCPSLSPAQTEHPKRPADGSKMPSEGLHLSVPSPKNPSHSVVPQVPGFPKEPEVLNNKPNREPKPFYPYPFPFYPQPNPGKPAPEQLTTTPEPEKPSASPKPQQQPEAPQGQVQQPFYPYPFPYHPWPKPGKPVLEPEKPTTAPETEKPSAAPEPEKQTTAPKPPQPPANPQGQVQQPFYPYPFPYHPWPKPGKPVSEPEKPTTAPETEKPSASPKPQQPEAPQGQVQQPFYPYPFPYHPWPKPGKPVSEPEKPTTAPETEKPSASPKPQQPEAPKGHVKQPFYPYPFPYHSWPKPAPVPEHPATAPEPEKPLAAPEPEKQTTDPKPPQPANPQGQVQQPFYPYPFPNYPQPKPEKPTPAPQPQQNITSSSKNNPVDSNSQLSNGIVSKNPQPGYPYMPPIHCPQFCPSGFSNCCPQIAFHQHLHQIIPAGIRSEDAPASYPVLQFLPSMAYPGFVSGLDTAPIPQKPTVTTTTQATTTSTPASSSPQSLPSENEKLPPDGNPTLLTGNPSMPTNLERPIYPYIAPNTLFPNWPYLPQNEELPNPSGSQSSKPSNERSMDPKDQIEPLPFVSASKKSTENEQTVNPNSEPKGYVLLQHGPPGREPNRLVESQLHFRHPVGDANILAQNMAWQHGKPQNQNVKSPQEKTQHPKQMGKGQSNSLPNVNHALRPGENPEGVPLFFPFNGPHFVPLPQDTVNVAHLNSKFKDFWRPMTPLSHRGQPLVPGKTSQRRSSAADHQAKGFNQPIQREVGHRRQ